MQLGTYLKLKRIEAGYSTAEMACFFELEKLNCTLIEENIQFPSEELLQALSKFYGFNYEELIETCVSSKLQGRAVVRLSTALQEIHVLKAISAELKSIHVEMAQIQRDIDGIMLKLEE